MEILRFGPGHRRLGGPPGTQNVEGAVIMADDRAVVSELAFGRYAMVVPHENPDNTALFIVISGAGWVQVGDERARINHGEAVVWPPAHAARRVHRRHGDARDRRRADRPVGLGRSRARPTRDRRAHRPNVEPADADSRARARARQGRSPSARSRATSTTRPRASPGRAASSSR